MLDETPEPVLNENQHNGWKDTNLMSLCDRSLRTLRRAAGFSAVALLCAAPAYAQAPPDTGPGYVPTMKDWVAVHEVIQNYRWGVEKQDHKAEQSAFWPDGEDIAFPNPGQDLGIKIPLDGSRAGMPGMKGLPPGGPPGTGAGGAPPGAPPGGLAGGPPGGPPPGGFPPGGPPPGGPPAGAASSPPPGGGVWHMPFADYFHFLSPTRAWHYEYFLSIYPQPEKPRVNTGTGTGSPYMLTRQTIVGWPGHYEDILEKRHGEWRILQRKSYEDEK